MHVVHNSIAKKRIDHATKMFTETSLFTAIVTNNSFKRSNGSCLLLVIGNYCVQNKRECNYA